MPRSWQSIFNAIVVGVAIAAGVTWLFRPATRLGASVETVDGRLEANEIRHVRGSGRIALVEFSDFECDYCSRHVRTTAREIDEHLLRSGRIRHVFVNFPLPTHLRARAASEAAECAAQHGQFWQMHDLLFDRSAPLDRDGLIKRAATLPLDAGVITRCLDSSSAAPRVKQDVKTGRRLGVDTTPTFFVGIAEPDGSIALMRRIIGAVEYQQFEFAVNDLRFVAAVAGNSQR